MRCKAMLAIGLSMVLLCTAGCQAESGTEFELYQSVVSDVTNNLVGVESEVESGSGYFEKSEMQGVTKTIEFRGAQYCGRYEKSSKDRLSSYTTDIFSDEAGIEFGLRADTGAIVSFNRMNKQFFETEPYLDEMSDPVTELPLLAREIAGDYVQEIDDYEMTAEEPTVRYKEKDGKSYRISYHVFVFTRNIKGFATSDSVYVKMTSKGNLASIVLGDIGVFSGIDIDFDKNTANASVDQKLDDVYQKAGYSILQSSVQKQTLAVTQDGLVCLITQINVQIKDSSKEEYGTGVVIRTTVGQR